jgi:glycosyltransferase involved in cell wall biosynthesis
MGRTLREHHPDAQLTVLLLDGAPDAVADFPGARMLGAATMLGESFGLLAAANPPAALNMAVLPHLLRAVLAAGADSVLYLGAGQRVLGSLDVLVDLIDEHDVVLVARARGAASSVIAPSESGEGPFSRQLLGVRVGLGADALLDAWPRYFIGTGDEGAAAVRGWMDGIPALAADVAVLRDRGYGLDPWSLAGKQVLAAGGGVDDALEVDGARARVIDLGELDPADPPSWFDGEDRIQLSAAPALQRLAARHADDLRSCGSEPEAALFTRLDDGLRLTPTIRTLLASAIADGAITRSPFTGAGRAELYAYLNELDGRGRAAGLTRLHMAIWEARADLGSGYRHIDGPDGSGFAGWLCAYGCEQEGLVPELLPPAPELAYRDADPHAHEAPPRWGVNLVGFFTSELGVGEAARLVVSALDAREIPVLPVQGNLIPPSRQNAEFAHVSPDQAAYPINLVCINGDGIPVFAREAGRSFFEGRHTIALWWWEVGDPPASWTEAYEFVDEVWVASQHVYDVIAPTSPVPVLRIRFPVAEPEVAHGARADLGLPEDGFLFLSVYDYHSVGVRKNPLGLIEAFKRAFPPGHGAKLVLKSINAETRREEHERVVLAAAEHADVTLLSGYVTGAEKNAIIAACDCYVSLHRSEGFGFTVAEAMLLGKPVIATRFGGTLEFTNDRNAYLVGYEPVTVGEGVYPYPADGIWAEPDLDEAAALMRRVLAAPEEARVRGAIARREMLERHSPAAAGASIERRLRLISERLYGEGARSLNLTRLPSLQNREVMPAKIAEPPSIEWGSGRLRRLRQRAQRPVANWARAYVEHERILDTELHSAIARIDSRLREVARTLQDQQQAQHAETLAVLRRLESELAGIQATVDGVEWGVHPPTSRLD